MITTFKGQINTNRVAWYKNNGISLFLAKLWCSPVMFIYLDIRGWGIISLNPCMVIVSGKSWRKVLIGCDVTIPCWHLAMNVSHSIGSDSDTEIPAVGLKIKMPQTTHLKVLVSFLRLPEFFNDFLIIPRKPLEVNNETIGTWLEKSCWCPLQVKHSIVKTLFLLRFHKLNVKQLI